MKITKMYGRKLHFRFKRALFPAPKKKGSTVTEETVSVTTEISTVRVSLASRVIVQFIACSVLPKSLFCLPILNFFAGAVCTFLVLLNGGLGKELCTT